MTRRTLRGIDLFASARLLRREHPFVKRLSRRALLWRRCGHNRARKHRCEEIPENVLHEIVAPPAPMEFAGTAVRELHPQFTQTIRPVATAHYTSSLS